MRFQPFASPRLTSEFQLTGLEGSLALVLAVSVALALALGLLPNFSLLGCFGERVLINLERIELPPHVFGEGLHLHKSPLHEGWIY